MIAVSQENYMQHCNVQVNWTTMSFKFLQMGGQWTKDVKILDSRMSWPSLENAFLFSLFDEEYNSH